MEINTAGYNEFLTAIKDMVLGDPTSIEVFADAIGISTSHLYQKLDPNYPEAKLTAREAFILMMNCQGLQPIIFLCAKRHLRADSLDCITSDKPTLAEELLDNASAYARYQEVMADSNASEEDATGARMKLDRELDEDHVAFCMARVKGHIYEGGKARLTHVPAGSGKGGRRQ